MSSKTHFYECNNCDHSVETKQFAEARECPECSAGMLVNVTKQTPDELKTIAKLIRESTAARGIDVFAVQECGLSSTQWADMTGRDRSTVARNIRRASDS